MHAPSRSGSVRSSDAIRRKSAGFMTPNGGPPSISHRRVGHAKAAQGRTRGGFLHFRPRPAPAKGSRRVPTRRSSPATRPRPATHGPPAKRRAPPRASHEAPSVASTSRELMSDRAAHRRSRRVLNTVLSSNSMLLSSVSTHVRRLQTDDILVDAGRARLNRPRHRLLPRGMRFDSLASLTSSVLPTSVGAGDSPVRTPLARGSVIGAHQASRSMRRALPVRDRLAREMRPRPRRPSSPTSTSSNHCPSREVSQVRGATAAHLAFTQRI